MIDDHPRTSTAKWSVLSINGSNANDFLDYVCTQKYITTLLELIQDSRNDHSRVVLLKVTCDQCNAYYMVLACSCQLVKFQRIVASGAVVVQ